MPPNNENQTSFPAIPTPACGAVASACQAVASERRLARTPATMPTERLAYSIQEAADLLGVHYFSVYRLIVRGKLKACRALRGKLLVPRAELLKLLHTQ